MRKTLLILTSVLAFTAQTAAAQQLIATEQDWRVFTLDQGGKKQCYIASAPAKSKGTFKKRGDAYLLVTSRSATQDEVNASSGFPYKKGTDAHVTLNTTDKFRLFTQGDQAWARDSKQDAAIVNAMKKAGTLTLRGTSPKESYAEDTYSLKGFSKAYEQMKKACK